MSRKTNIIIVSVILGFVAAAVIGFLIWWLVTDTEEFTIIKLEGEGIGDIEYTAAFTRIRGSGDIFWWFYPTLPAVKIIKPIILWVDGVTGVPPSLLANFGMFGPYDFNLNQRSDSWINNYNLLFVDAPLGTGFSTAQSDSQIPGNLDATTDHLLFTLESFYRLHEDYADTPLYIFGEGHGAQIALALARRLASTDPPGRFQHNLKGVVLGNGIVSPALALTKLGFYLEELGYIDANGRAAIETLSEDVSSSVSGGQLRDAFDKFITLGDFVNEKAGAVAVNLGHIVDKLTREASRDYFGQRQYMQEKFGLDAFSFMQETVAPALGIPSDVSFDYNRAAVVDAFRNNFMAPATPHVEFLLRNTDLKVVIYNGNLDAVSNTPGQLEWVDNLQWPGQEEFKTTPRRTLVINRLVEGYFRETPRLSFYWMNAAGQSVPLDSPLAMRRILDRITQPK